MRNKHLPLLLLFLICLMQTATAKSTSVVIDGIKYSLNETSKTAGVYGNDYSGNIVIPATVAYDGVDYSVTSIGRSAFYGCTGLTGIDIPSSVTKIGYYAFSGCTGLTSIKIPNSVNEIENNAFYGCTGITGVELPNSLTKIGDYAFGYCI